MKVHGKFLPPSVCPASRFYCLAPSNRSRKIQFASFTCRVTPELLQSTPVKHHGAQSPPASVPPPTASPPPTPVSGAVDANASHSDANALSSQAVHTEIGLMCLTNLGECMVLSIPELKRQINSSAVRREDIK